MMKLKQKKKEILPSLSENTKAAPKFSRNSFDEMRKKGAQNDVVLTKLQFSTS